MSGVVHIAGTCYTVDLRYQVQRCAFCGAVLIERDLRLTQAVVPDCVVAGCAKPEHQHSTTPLGWEVNTWVEIGPGYSCVVVPERTDESGPRYPKGSCISAYVAHQHTEGLPSLRIVPSLEPDQPA